MVRWLACVLLATACACNVVRHEHKRLASQTSGAGVREQTVTLGDDTVHFWASSGDRPLVLLHGFGASAIWQFHDQRGLAAGGRQIVVPDLLWFGGSHSVRHDYSLGHQADMVRALLDHLGIERADILGVSYGGLVAYELASRSPERIRRVILVDSPGPVYTAEDWKSLLETLGAGGLFPILIPAEPADVKRLMGMIYFDPPWMPDFVAGQVIAEMYHEYRAEKAELLRTAMSRIGEAPPAAIGQPALVIWGREDPIFPAELGQRLALFLSGPLVVIERARHTPNMEHPEQFNQHVLDFLRE